MPGLSCIKDPGPVAAALEIVSISPLDGATDVDKSAPVRLTFSTEVEADSLSRYLNVLDITDGLPVPVLYAFGSPAYQGPFDVFEYSYGRFHRDHDIRVTIDEGLPGVDGSRLAEDFVVQFHTRSDSLPIAFHYEIQWQAGNPPTLGAVYFDFEDPIDFVPDLVRVEPDSPAVSYWMSTDGSDIIWNYNFLNEDTVRLNLLGLMWSQNLRPDTTYRVILSAGITDYEGDRLGDEIIIEIPGTE